jgi:hypothetical protein
MLRMLSISLLLAAGVAACSQQPVGRWQKMGANEQAISRDDAECRAIAQQEAVRRYPYGINPVFVGTGGVTMSQQRDDVNRSNTEQAAFTQCMESRGYHR